MTKMLHDGDNSTLPPGVESGLPGGPQNGNAGQNQFRPRPPLLRHDWPTASNLGRAGPRFPKAQHRDRFTTGKKYCPFAQTFKPEVVIVHTDVIRDRSGGIESLLGVS